MTVRITRRRFLKIASLSLGALGIGGLPPLSSHYVRAQQKDSFSFVHLTDIHVQPELRAAEGFRMAVEKINSLKPRPDFAIAGGDLVMDALEVDYNRADYLFNLYGEISSKLEIPVYNVIGNRDVFGLYPGSGIEPDHPLYGKRMFINRLGEGRTYSSFDVGNWHFILLDSVGMTKDRRYIGIVDSMQLNWLRKDLEAVGKERPIVIVTHIPVFTMFYQITQGTTASTPDRLVITNGREVWEAFSPYNVKMVLQGHLHICEELIYKGTHFITSGAVCGNWWRGPRMGFPEGFGVVTVQGDGIDWRYETYGWQAAS